MLRAAAAREPDAVSRQTLLCLAEDCEAIAAEQQSQQPGKPKPPGNPPSEEKEPESERPSPIREPPRPLPVPPVERPPAPMPMRTRRRLV
jgi:hypothetical protein